MEHCPNVCSIPPQELLTFCADAGYALRLEPAGSLLIPPDYNVNITDWERSLRLRCAHRSTIAGSSFHDSDGCSFTASLQSMVGGFDLPFAVFVRFGVCTKVVHARLRWWLVCVAYVTLNVACMCHPLTCHLLNAHERVPLCREGMFTVLEEDPNNTNVFSTAVDQGMSGSSSATATTSAATATQGTLWGSQVVPRSSEYSQSQLDSIRARLEMLLPAEDRDTRQQGE